MVSENKQEGAPAVEKAADAKAVPVKPNWRGKRGKMLQEAGAALLAEEGTDTEKLARFLKDMKD